jgi:hypothetical protein
VEKMKVVSYIFFYEETNSEKDSGSLIAFFEDGGYWRESSGCVDYVSYPVIGGVMLEQKVKDCSGEYLTQICVLWQARPVNSFASYKGGNNG